MANKLEQYVDIIVLALDSKREFFQIYLIPILIFLLDFFLRLFIGVDLSDAGADMALLATAAFVSVAVDEDRKTNARPFMMVIFLISFMLPWIFCLWSVSNRNPLYIIKVGTQIINIQILFSALAWFVGLTSLILSGVFISRITAIEQTKSQLRKPTEG